MSIIAVIIILFVFFVLFIGMGILIIFMIISSVKKKGKMGINFSQVKCPKCGEGAPKVRIPKNFSQAMFGGWTCSKCGTEMDKWGKEKIKV